MLARRLPGILPPLDRQESIEVTKVLSAAGEGDGTLVKRRPFRAPHHTISTSGLAGGGSNPRPGEVSLAHHGVLFLDEFPEFARRTLEVLRQPMEDGQVTISRVAATLSYPARFTLVCSMNPCPCGYAGDRRRTCRCSAGQIERYQSRISGPLLDRIDLFVDVPRLTREELRGGEEYAEGSDEIRGRVAAAREVQTARQGVPNAALLGRHFARCALLGATRRRFSPELSTGWGSRAGATTGSCGWPAPSRTCRGRRGSPWSMWPRRSTTGGRPSLIADEEAAYPWSAPDRTAVGPLPPARGYALDAEAPCAVARGADPQMRYIVYSCRFYGRGGKKESPSGEFERCPHKAGHSLRPTVAARPFQKLAGGISCVWALRCVY